MPNSIPGPAYRITTTRLVIRCWNPADAPLLKAAVDASLEHLRPWMPWAEQEPQALDQKIEGLRRFRGKFDLGQDFVYGIFNRQESQVLGGTGLHTRAGEGAREIGYWIHADWINRGLATEASAALTRVAFEIDHVDRVEIHCDPANVRSAAVPRKLSYTHEATLRQRLPLSDGAFRDAMIWTLLAGEYPASPAARAEIQALDALGRQIL
jgi:RimJ/RimL family protein N-acetyltransferase